MLASVQSRSRARISRPNGHRHTAHQRTAPLAPAPAASWAKRASSTSSFSPEATSPGFSLSYTFQTALQKAPRAIKPPRAARHGSPVNRHKYTDFDTWNEWLSPPLLLQSNQMVCYSPQLAYLQFKYIRHLILCVVRPRAATEDHEAKSLVSRAVSGVQKQIPRIQGAAPVSGRRMEWKPRKPIDALSLSILSSKFSWMLSSELTSTDYKYLASDATALPSVFKEFLKTQEASSIPPVTVEKLHVTEVGDGETNVILLHGLGNDHTYWDEFLQNMNLRKFKYVVPDLLGHGQSSSAPHLAYTPDTHLYFLERDVVAKLGTVNSGITKRPVSSLSADKDDSRDSPEDDDQDESDQPNQSSVPSGVPQKGFHIIGHGLGAILALELASRMPNRVLSVSLISLPYYETEGQATEDLMNNWAPKPLHPVLSRLSPFASVSPLLKPIIELTRPIQFVDTVKYEYLHAICSSFEECVLRHRIDNAAAHLARIGTVPITLLHGTEDHVVRMERCQAFYSKYFQVSRLDVVTGGGHDLPKSHSRELARHLLSIIE